VIGGNATVRDNADGAAGGQPAPPRAKHGCVSPGCLIALAVAVAPWILNAGFVGIRNEVNHVKWRLRGSPSYIATIHRTGLAMADKATLHVSKGQITAVESSFCQDCTASNYEEYTVERLFAGIPPICALLFPVWVCHIKYDPYFGYPSEIVTDCAIPGSECYTTSGVNSLVPVAD
jgi:Family of unknown function (DUF6174)